MRGIEASLYVLEQIKSGRMASEILRKTADLQKMKAPDISLASSLIYLAMRRRELWQNIYKDFIKEKNKGKIDEMPDVVQDSLLIGTAGILGLRHFAQGVLVNALIDNLKKKNQFKWVRMVNAVLRGVGENGAAKLEEFHKSADINNRAMFAGVPVWSIPAWERTWGRAELFKLFDFMAQPPLSSLRPTPEKKHELIESLKEQKLISPSYDVNNQNSLTDAIRLNSTVLPSSINGFEKGLCTVQSEGSILVTSLVKKFYKCGLILDMCSGRGIKAGQILQDCPNAEIECWELSENRHKSAVREMKRLNLLDRAKLRQGNAFELEPLSTPDFIILDAPCSGSGTWNRKPDAKWRLDWDKMKNLEFTQKKLLERAVKLCAPQGVILYITCSLLKNENENVVSSVLSENKNCADFTVSWSDLGDGLNGEKLFPFHKGRPWGTYIWPETPWLDGFYCSLIMKK